jgi:hypothetical protein
MREGGMLRRAPHVRGESDSAKPVPLLAIAARELPGPRLPTRLQEPVEAKSLDLLGARWRRRLLVERPRRRFRDVVLGQGADDEAPAAPRERDLEDVPGPDQLVGTAGRPVHVDLSPVAGTRRLRAGREEAGDVQKDVEPDPRELARLLEVLPRKARRPPQKTGFWTDRSNL